MHQYKDFLPADMNSAEDPVFFALFRLECICLRVGDLKSRGEDTSPRLLRGVGRKTRNVIFLFYSSHWPVLFILLYHILLNIQASNKNPALVCDNRIFSALSVKLRIRTPNTIVTVHRTVQPTLRNWICKY
jgi:hypothetical protein